MRSTVLTVASTVLVVCTGQLLWAVDDKPAQQPEAKPAEAAVKAPTPNTSDEPLAAKFSAQKAAQFLDQVSLAWTTERKCGSCHTNYAYMLAQPALGKTPSPAATEIRKFFEDRAANWDTAKPRWDTEVVATAVTLAIHDAETTGKLHSTTRSALDRMWTLQQEDGAWNWLKCDWPPLESDDYYGAVFVALGVGLAPDSYADTPAAKAGMEKVRRYLKETPPPSLHHSVMLLWASLKTPGLMTPDDREATIRELLARQRPNGGWSLTSLGDWKRRDGLLNDPGSAPSDGYATGLVVYVLRRAGLPSDHDAIRRGVVWLKSSQRESGRWFTRSVNNDKYHYIANAGSAYAVMALEACGELTRD